MDSEGDGNPPLKNLSYLAKRLRSSEKRQCSSHRIASLCRRHLHPRENLAVSGGFVSFGMASRFGRQVENPSNGHPGAILKEHKKPLNGRLMPAATGIRRPLWLRQPLKIV